MKSLLSGFFGGCCVLALFIIVSLLFHKQSQIFTPVHIVTSNYEINDTTISNITNFDVKEKLEEIEKLKAKGILLTPQEYTAHIESFYSNLIAILIALLAVFSLATYFHLRFVAKEEIMKQVKEALTSSTEIEQIIRDNIEGKIDDAIYDAIDSEIVTKRELISAIQNEMRKSSTKYDIEDESELANLKVEKTK